MIKNSDRTTKKKLEKCTSQLCHVLQFYQSECKNLRTATQNSIIFRALLNDGVNC